jgi:hypothetical protein
VCSKGVRIRSNPIGFGSDSDSNSLGSDWISFFYCRIGLDFVGFFVGSDFVGFFLVLRRPSG